MLFARPIPFLVGFGADPARTMAHKVVLGLAGSSSKIPSGRRGPRGKGWQTIDRPCIAPHARPAQLGAFDPCVRLSVLPPPSRARVRNTTRHRLAQKRYIQRVEYYTWKLSQRYAAAPMMQVRGV